MAPTLTQPLAKYAHTRQVGSLVYVAGQGARDPKTNVEAGITIDAKGQVTGHDIRVQTAAVLENVERALKDVGLDRGHIADVTVFLTDMREFAAMNEVWNDFFKDTRPPTRTTVAVAALPGRNFVEMKAIACKHE